ncbi:heterokaryon incompatibility protein-domain-containing protein [Paraphoma chrysanthemicola]|nr:heterokaryon incompatibility protein-domain-containing protein [Paraphoma chrysanthemicola]
MSSQRGQEKNEYEYSPLPAGRTIRLLYLQPGLWHQTLRCTLIPADLDGELVDYEAISYAWGSSLKPRTITCSGRDVAITESLFTALRRFRHVDRDRVLWADAICINQGDTTEKNSQVKLMHQIYRKTSSVLIWLGDEDDTTVQAALDGICEYFESHPPANKSCGQLCYYWYASRIRTFKENNTPFLPENGEVRGLSYLTSCTWFGRGWVIQELALARVAYIFWGHAQIDFSWISEAGICAIKSPVDFHEFGSLVSLGTMRIMQQNPSRLDSFYILLSSTRNSKFADARDRIYGILGLRTKECDPETGATLIEPDYELSILECYRMVAELLLLKHNDMDMLLQIQHGPYIPEEWPSWILDWSKKMYTIGHRAEALLASPRPAVVSKRMLRNKMCICVEGFIIDRVSHLHRPSQGNVELEDSPLSWQRQQDLLRELTTMYSHECLSWTFGQPRVLETGGSQDDWVESLQAFMLWTPASDEEISVLRHRPGSLQFRANRFWDNFKHILTGRTIFISDGGRLGLGPLALKTNDHLVLIFGTTKPAALRSDHGLWRLVGECFLNGFMYGHDVDSWRDAGEPIETFCMW